MKKFFIGIDVSKLKLDFCLFQKQEILKEGIIANHTGAIKDLLEKLMGEDSPELFLICAEYTGQYTYPLSCVCAELRIDLWLENPAQIKYRSGVQRGKDDKLDAYKIACYSERFEDMAHFFSLPDRVIGTLKQLVSERDMYVSDKAKYKGQLTDQKDFMDAKVYNHKSKRLKKIILEIERVVEQIDKEIWNLINSDATLSRQHQLLCSIDGVGERTATKMIIETNAFKDFKNPRKFCCHAGVAPFSYTSGSSQRSRNKVSHRADKSIKTLLHMAALSACKTKGDLGEYYIRKVNEGKNKMTVINAIRAKLVLRMFAVIKNDRFYTQDYVNSFA